MPGPAGWSSAAQRRRNHQRHGVEARARPSALRPRRGVSGLSAASVTCACAGTNLQRGGVGVSGLVRLRESHLSGGSVAGQARMPPTRTPPAARLALPAQRRILGTGLVQAIEREGHQGAPADAPRGVGGGQRGHLQGSRLPASTREVVNINPRSGQLACVNSGGLLTSPVAARPTARTTLGSCPPERAWQPQPALRRCEEEPPTGKLPYETGAVAQFGRDAATAAAAVKSDV